MTTLSGYTISAAARLLEVNRRTMYRWLEAGRIQTTRKGTRQILTHEQIVKIKLRLGIGMAP